MKQNFVDALIIVTQSPDYLTVDGLPSPAQAGPLMACIRSTSGLGSRLSPGLIFRALMISPRGHSTGPLSCTVSPARFATRATGPSHCCSGRCRFGDEPSSGFHQEPLTLGFRPSHGRNRV